jgi:hypothetical protein
MNARDQPLIASAAVSSAARRLQDVEGIDGRAASVLLARNGELGGLIVLTVAELAERLRVPASWVRNRTRARTPKTERIPCVRFGHYVRFLWNSPELQDWITRRRQ